MTRSTEELGKFPTFPRENVDSDTEITSWCFVLNEEVCTVNALFDYLPVLLSFGKVTCPHLVGPRGVEYSRQR